MNNQTRKSKQENKRLQHQLEITKAELNTVKNSSGYKSIRLVGHIKNEIKKSPKAFAKKAITRTLSKKSIFMRARHINKNIGSTDSLEMQYKLWITLNEPDSMELSEQRVASDEFIKKPVVSIITPVFNPPKDVFIELVESVLSQTYPYFELCLGDFGDSEEIAQIINEYSKMDSRIVGIKFKSNEGIAANSSKILKKAKGEFIALLDHDDTLSPDALFENVKLINEREVDFIFSDKDKIDEKGNRFEPFFKPGWSPEIMLSANYLTHLNVMRRSVVEEVGAWDPKTDGAQDWDLFLKIVDKTDKIGHIPKVLYHWRVIATSTALSIETKPYALKGQRVAVDKYLKANKIPATSYHSGAELLLKWDLSISNPQIVVVSSSVAQTKKFIASVNADLCSFTILTSTSHTIDTKNVKVVVYRKNEITKALSSIIESLDGKYVILLSDKVDISKLSIDNMVNLFGWLKISNVSGVFPKILDHKSELCIDGGSLVDKGTIRPLFEGSPPYHQAPIGNIEWIKNFMLGSALFLATEQAEALKALILAEKCASLNDENILSAIQLAMTINQKRLVFNPKISISIFSNVEFNISEYDENISQELRELTSENDPFANINLTLEDPMKISLVTKEPHNDELSRLSEQSPYSSEAQAHADNFKLSKDEISNSIAHMSEASKHPIQNTRLQFLFILPGFSGIYAGLNNIFSYASYLESTGHKVSFGLLVEQKDLKFHISLISEKYPKLAVNENFHSVNMGNVESLPASDIAICTQWATAYLLAKYNKCKRKCYFIQDKEASFYPKGTISALVDNTYKFGFFAIANTPGLLTWYENEYGGDGVTIKSKISTSAYSLPAVPKVTIHKPYKVFFYARPNEPRNAFELGAAALKILKKKYKSDVEIYAAGADWDVTEYGLEDIMMNLGKISYDKLPSFYRSMDVGLMFMFSGHPGVVASELMASGCPVVVNEYDDETWNSLYKNGVNAVVSYPTSTSIFESIDSLLTKPDIRNKLIPNASKTVNDFYGDYETSCQNSINVLKGKI